MTPIIQSDCTTESCEFIGACEARTILSCVHVHVVTPPSGDVTKLMGCVSLSEKNFFQILLIASAGSTCILTLTIFLVCSTAIHSS